MTSKRITSFISLLLLLIVSTILLASCKSSAGTPAASATSSGSSVSAGEALMQSRCSVCHSVSRIKSAHHTADEWKTTVERMISKGARLTSQEEQTLVDYLAQNYK
jgi:hypothetical protein